MLHRELHRIRVRTKEPGHAPDPAKPFVLPEGATVEELAERIHHDLAAHLEHARLRGPHARFEGQQVDRRHVLGDGDVIELHAGRARARSRAGKWTPGWAQVASRA
jgi:ribosome-interacting GTPase 1